MEGIVGIINLLLVAFLPIQPTLYPKMTMTTVHLCSSAVDVFALDAKNNANKVGLSCI